MFLVVPDVPLFYFITLFWTLKIRKTDCVMLLYKASCEKILRVYLMLPYTKEHRLKRKKVMSAKIILFV